MPPKCRVNKKTARRVEPYPQQNTITNRIRTINQLMEEVHENSNALNSSTFELTNARKRLQHCLSEINSREEKLRERVNRLQKTKDDLDEMATDINALHKFENEKDNVKLNFQAALALQDTTIAQRQIDHITNELDFLSPIVPESRDNDLKAYRCYEHVKIPSTFSDLPFCWDSFDAKNVGKCAVCIENPIDRIILGCGHMCLCSRCSAVYLEDIPEEHKTCPMCRAKIDDIIEPKLI